MHATTLETSALICLAALCGCSDNDSMNDLGGQGRDAAPHARADTVSLDEPTLRLAAADGETLTVPVEARQFEDWDAVYAFAMDELGGQPVFDEDGEILGVVGVSVVAGDVRYRDEATGVQFEGRELVPAMLGGSEGVFYVGGETIPLGDPTGPDQVITTATDPLFDASDFDCVGGTDCEACDGGDCISGHSWRTNYWVYKSVGSRTEQSSGGYTSVPYACCPTGTLVNVDGVQQCRVVTEWLPPEPPHFPKPIPIGYGYVNPSTCSYQTTDNTLTLVVRPHSSGPSLPVNTMASEQNVREVELSAWSVGVNVDFGSMADVDGVCGLHLGSRGGVSLTRAGSGSFEYCDAGL